jgi:hypothetical protein
MEHGKPQKQAVAIAMHTAGKSYNDSMCGADIFTGTDAMLSFGGGWPVSTLTGPGDTPMTPEEQHAAGNIARNAVDDGKLGRMAADYLGENPVTVDAKTFGRDDGLTELKKELNKFLSEEQKEAEHEGKDVDPTNKLVRGESY